MGSVGSTGEASAGAAGEAGGTAGCPPLRVLHLARVVNRYDFIDTVVRFADPRRFTMMVGVLDPASNIEDPRYGNGGPRCWVLPARTRGNYPGTILRLSRLLRQERVQVLHTHHYDEAVIGLAAARLARVPATVLGRHYHDELYLVATGPRRRALLAVEGLCNRLAGVIVVPSTAIRDLLTGRQGVPAGKIRVIPYGFDFTAERYRPAGASEVAAVRRRLGIEGAFVVGNVGRQHPLKGQADLIEAFARLAPDLPAARLLMVGDGPARPALEARAAARGVAGRVIFAGWRRDVPLLLDAMDVLAHPTRHEAFSQLMVETLAHGRPLVIGRVAGVPDCVEDGRTAVVVGPGDVDALEAALRWVAAHPDAAGRMGEAGSRHVRATLDIRVVVPRYEAAYREALGRGCPRIP
jgi:glycosyltransferase involved in cell wall biosynthesis